MARLLDKYGLLYLIKKLSELFIKKGEPIPTAPTIHKIRTDEYGSVTLNNVEANQYWIVEGNVLNFTLNSMKKMNSAEGKKCRVYIQFNSGSYINMKFNDTILWENGERLESVDNCLYRIELKDCIGYWVGRCVRFDEKKLSI